jgi:hypothetical protein
VSFCNNSASSGKQYERFVMACANHNLCQPTSSNGCPCFDRDLQALIKVQYTILRKIYVLLKYTSAVSEDQDHYVGFEVLITMVVTPCSPLKIKRRFGGTCRLHLQGGRKSQARNQREASSNLKP